MTDLQTLMDALVRFRDERDWAQFHNPKDLAVAIAVEAGELLEAYLWKEADGADPRRVAEELADVLCYAFLLADRTGLDIATIITDKIRKNAEKYPVDKARGTAKKYDEL